jgi:hypothetical protein
MTNTKFELEPFYLKNNFSLWQSTIKKIPMQSGLIEALYEKLTKPATMSDDEWAELDILSIRALPKS